MFGFINISRVPPISIITYRELGRAKISDTLASPFWSVKSLSFLSRQKIAPPSGSNAMINCSFVSAEAIPAFEL